MTFRSASCMVRRHARSSPSLPYWLFRLYRSVGRYPWGDTEAEGGGSHTAEMPASAMVLACSLSFLYQLPLWLSQLKPCRMISNPSPAAGPVLVAPPPEKRRSPPGPRAMAGSAGWSMAERRAASTASIAAMRLSSSAAASALAASLVSVSPSAAATSMISRSRLTRLAAACAISAAASSSAAASPSRAAGVVDRGRSRRISASAARP
mmetsp:Transcript_15860/g.47732  ORF Transcript_15860/g.47732 Transcript_15860/m.47732 type:complete len:208 (-) Transcript_15860:957-1580(-)